MYQLKIIHYANKAALSLSRVKLISEKWTRKEAVVLLLIT